MDKRSSRVLEWMSMTPDTRLKILKDTIMGYEIHFPGHNQIKKIEEQMKKEEECSGK